MRVPSFVALVLLCAPRIPLLAQQQAPSLEPGARLRLTYPCPREGAPAASQARSACRSEGTLVRLHADTIALAAAGASVSHGLSAVSRVEVSRGYRTHRLPAAGAGFLLGAGVTFVVLNSGGSTSLCNQSANQDAMSPGECLGLTALGSVVGAGLGALVGGWIRTERWDDVPVERLRVSLGPQRDRLLGLSVAVAF
jgi:hypothetical protein